MELQCQIRAKNIYLWAQGSIYPLEPLSQLKWPMGLLVQTWKLAPIILHAHAKNKMSKGQLDSSLEG